MVLLNDLVKKLENSEQLDTEEIDGIAQNILLNS